MEVAHVAPSHAVAWTSERWWDSEAQIVGTVRHVNESQWEAQAAVRRRRWRPQGDNILGRVERAEALVHLGELSSA